jgi:hypothetical protein
MLLKFRLECLRFLLPQNNLRTGPTLSQNFAFKMPHSRPQTSLKNSVPKAFRVYIPGYHHIEISRDVTFDEDAALKKSKRCQLEEVYEEELVAPRVTEPVREVIASPDEETLEDHDIIESQEPPQMSISHKRKSAWARELIQDGEKYGIAEGTVRQVKKPKPFSSYMALMCDLLENEPT